MLAQLSAALRIGAVSVGLAWLCALMVVHRWIAAGTVPVDGESAWTAKRVGVPSVFCLQGRCRIASMDRLKLKILPLPVARKLLSMLCEKRRIARKICHQLKLALRAACQGAGMENGGVPSYQERLHRPEKASDPRNLPRREFYKVQTFYRNGAIG